MKDNKKETNKFISNEAIRGKPYLDIDRVINEGKTGGALYRKRDT
ncbi:hypothetical protein [Alkalihalobacillus deserti]|nr:hypothetical protein [Alkalihalobacillus deserti]